jgi:TP901 family phage tail tape measure protein
MQQLLASLVIGMSVKDEAFKAAMAANRAEVRKTGQEFDRGADTMGGAIDRAANTVNAAAIRIADGLAGMGRSVRNAGVALTVGLTLPLAGLGHASKDTASDFEAAMNRVNAAMVSASPEQLEKLGAAALTLGPRFGKSAIEAASAIESLAKNGMDASEILGGGLISALKLSVVGQAELGGAADATTDILEQFHLSTGQLPGVVDKVSGALDASKLSFDGYKDAIGQVGGIAGGLGYQFNDMNTALAAVIPLMTGGSDAGTSFKTFLISLVPQSKEAAGVMDDLGISFFDASGKAKSLSAVAEILNSKLSGLNDRSRQTALTKMFGTDGMRVAIALMQAGAKGIADVQAQIDKASAQQKIDVLLDGEAAATQRAAAGWERLKIAIGGAGIIQAYTAVKNAAGSVLNTISASPPWFFKLGVAIGALVAATGPLVIAAFTLGKIALPLLLLRLGPIALGFSALINPVGVLIRLLGSLAVQAGAATVIGRLGAAMLGFAGPVGLAITALAIFGPLLMRTAEASDAAKEATDTARSANEKATDTTMQLASATGKLRLEIIAKARADRQAALDAMKKAQADMQAARATYVRAQADNDNQANFATNVGAPGAVAASTYGRGKAVEDARVNLQSHIDTLDKRIDTVNKYSAIVRTPASPALTNMDFDADPKSKGKASGKSAADLAKEAARNEAQYQDDLGRARVEQLNAIADLTGSARARYTADMAGLDEDRQSTVRQNATNESLNAAQRVALLAEKDKELVTRRAIAEQVLSNALTQETYDLAKARNDAEQDAIRAQIDASDSITGRRNGELRLLELQRKQEDADLDLILATKNSASVEWANADKRKGMLDGIYAPRIDAAKRNNAGPAENYLRELSPSVDAVNEKVQDIGVSALKDLNAQLTDAILGAGSLASAFADMGKRIIASLIDIAIQQAVMRPLANALFGTADAAGNRSGGAIGSIGSYLSSTFGGGKANGGGIDPSNWYVVGERGPEIFAPGVSGTVIPNGGRGAPRDNGGVMEIRLRDEMLDARIISGSSRVTQAGIQQNNSQQSKYAGRKLGR